MEYFSPTITCREVYLETAADIVQHSFIVQDSISALNLELTQSYLLFDEDMDADILPSFSYSKDTIISEEKCRKVLTSSRSIMYTLHLDIPKDKERSLKTDWTPGNGFHLLSETDSLHLINESDSLVSKICMEDGFYTNVLSSHIDYACSRSDQSQKLLKWFVKSDVFVKPEVARLPSDITCRIVDSFHPARYDAEFVKDCFRKIREHLSNFLFTQEPFKHMLRIYFLFHFYRYRRETRLVWFERIIFPRVDGLNEFLGEELRKIKIAKPPRRRKLMLQALTFYITSTTQPFVATEFIRVFWSHADDALLSRNEFAAAVPQRFGATTVAAACNFYSGAVGELRDHVEPRPLKHYCRTAVRRAVLRRVQWMSDGISELGLPKTLQSYVNLDD